MKLLSVYVLSLTSALAAPIIIEEDDYRLTIDPRGRVCALEISPAEFAPFDNFFESSSNVSVMTSRLLEHFDDEFDFIFLVDNVDEGGGGGRHFPVRNSIQGTGKSNFDSTGYYGSDGQLQSAIHLTNPNTLRGGPSLHEIAHRWANRLDSIYNSGGHWGYSSVGGQLGGWAPGTLVDLGGGQYDAGGYNGKTSFGTFANGGNSLPYAPLELYLMGLIPANEVADLQVARGASWVTQSQGIFSATSIDTVTINDIIADEGARIPDLHASQKNFRGLVVLLTTDPVTPERWDQMNIDAASFSLAGDNGSSIFNFWEATGGRATLQLDGLLDALQASKETPILESSSPFISKRLDGATASLTQTTIMLRNDFSNPLPWQSEQPDWITVTPSSGTLAPGTSINATLSLNANSDVLPSGNHAERVRFINPNNGHYSEEPVQLLVASTIFADDFESGSLSVDWTQSGSGTYRVRVLDAFAPIGNFKAILDDSVSDSAYSSCQLTFSADLLGWTGLVLQFDAREFGDESHSPPATAPFASNQEFDGVSIRVSPDADEWYEITGLRGLSDSYRSFSIDLNEELTQLGLTPTSTVQIRFNQYDNFAATGDGIAIDNILLAGSPPTALTNWALSHGLSGSDLLPTADPDGDQLTNLEEFAFNSSPLLATRENKRRLRSIVIEGKSYATLTLPVRSGAIFSGLTEQSASFDGITYTFQGSLDLTNWTETVVESSPADSSGLALLSPGWEYRSFRPDGDTSANPQQFFRVRIAETP